MAKSKTINGRSPRQQQRLQELILDRMVAKYQRRIGKEIARAMRQAARNLEKGAFLPVDSVRPEHEKRMSRILLQLWSESGQAIQDTLIDTAKHNRLIMELKLVEVEGTPTADAIMVDFLRQYGGLKITQITGTTLDDINSVVSQGITDGLSELEIGRLVYLVAPTKGASRAQTIARTESHQAANVTAQGTANAAGLTMRRQWVSASGERTRKDHREANGQTVDMHEPFKVGGENLMYPGDPAGSAKNVINCRCAVVFIL